MIDTIRNTRYGDRIEGSKRREERMALHFTLGGFGRSFATRGRGAELRGLLLERIGTESDVVLDFSGVAHVTYSFADELVGRLTADHGLDVELDNAEPSVERIVRRAVDRRSTPAIR